MQQDETEREVTLATSPAEIRVRMQTPRSVFIDQDKAFSAARGVIEAAGNG